MTQSNKTALDILLLIGGFFSLVLAGMAASDQDWMPSIVLALNGILALWMRTWKYEIDDKYDLFQ